MLPLASLKTVSVSKSVLTTTRIEYDVVDPVRVALVAAPAVLPDCVAGDTSVLSVASFKLLSDELLGRIVKAGVGSVLKLGRSRGASRSDSSWKMPEEFFLSFVNLR